MNATWNYVVRAGYMGVLAMYAYGSQYGTGSPFARWPWFEMVSLWMWAAGCVAMVLAAGMAALSLGDD